MNLATGLVTGHTALPELARDAVASAMARAGLDQADQVLLLLSPHFARHAQPALIAAARASACLSISGMTASGLLTENGWSIDQPAAAALVLGGLGPAASAAPPRLAFAGHGRLPGDWLDGPGYAGLLESNALVWSHGRLQEAGSAATALPGLQATVAHATGLRHLGEVQPVTASNGHELRQLGRLTAQESLRRALPGEYRNALPLHQVALLRGPDVPAVAVLSAGPAGSLVLTEALLPGERVCWGIRQPLAAEAEMRQVLQASASGCPAPAFALMWSCIGRGPLFYGDDDHDLNALRETFPRLPILGAYGTGQIVPLAGGNRLFHNSVLTLLFEKAHV